MRRESLVPMRASSQAGVRLVFLRRTRFQDGDQLGFPAVRPAVSSSSPEGTRPASKAGEASEARCSLFMDDGSPDLYAECRQ